ncbi:MAG: hypothetical protein ACREN4_01015 [Candidatus Dormibacteria bacterium]
MQGLVAVALWLTLVVGLQLVGVISSFPAWADPLVPVPVLVIVADTLRPRPYLLRSGRLPARRTLYWVGAGASGAAAALGLAALLAPAPTTDQPYTIVCAARDLWHGVDPYRTFEPQCLRQLGSPLTAVTPLESGPFASLGRYPSNQRIKRVLRRDQASGTHAGFPPYGYPPEATLLVLPVAFLGWTLVALFVIALTALLLFAIWGRAGPGLALGLAWQLAALSVLWVSFRWNPEDIAYLILALAWARIDRPRLSSVAMAAAVCSNPLTWVCLPVYLAVLARDPARRQRWAWLAGSLLAGVLPWVLWDHQLPAQLWRFVTLPEFPLGATPSTLLPLPSHLHWLFDLAFVAGIALATLVAWRSPQWRWGMAVLVYASFLVSWRAPLYYVMPVLWLSPAVAIGATRLGAAGLVPASSRAGALRRRGWSVRRARPSPS